MVARGELRLHRPQNIAQYIGPDSSQFNWESARRQPTRNTHDAPEASDNRDTALSFIGTEQGEYPQARIVPRTPSVRRSLSFVNDSSISFPFANADV